MKRIFLVAMAALCASPLFAATVLDSATYTIYNGWNAIYLPVTPTNSADEVFADWPVESVGWYDQAAFLRTKQFTDSAADTTLGAVENGMKMWKRNAPEISGFSSLLANGIYVFYGTNTTAETRVICGVPEAMRVSWHVATSTNAPLNFVGISVGAGNKATLTEKGYFQGLDTGWTFTQGVLRDPTGDGTTPTLDFFYGGKPTKENFGVVAMDATRVSDWSGALYVSPMNGLDFGTNLCQGVLSVRNDSGTNRTVHVDLRRMEVEPALPLLTNIKFLDPARHTAWQDNLVEKGYTCELVAGETLSLRIAIDRTSISEVAAGTEYGGLLTISDASTDRPTCFRTTVPFSFTADGGEFSRTGWPTGLWSATLSLDKVSRVLNRSEVVSYEEKVETEISTIYEVVTNATTGVVSTNEIEVAEATTNLVPVYVTAPVPAGSTMTMRVLVHVDANGAMTLMQRARVGTRRVSSVVLPTDAPLTATGTGTFGRVADFAWTVGEESRVNPFRHARHPDHDGLDAYFKEKAPSGDDFNNYMGTVKPELFSISNEVSFAWNSATTAAAWNPEETLTGTCTWKLTGLRREGPITAAGTFTMKRIAAKEINTLKEEL